MLLVQYPKCSTCRKAKQWLEQQGAAFEVRHIVEQTPTAEELDVWQQRSGLPLKRFFNTSGQLYRNLELKDKLDGMTRKQQLDLLAANGMLIKRPILVTEDAVLVGFREEAWKQLLQP